MIIARDVKDLEARNTTKSDILAKEKKSDESFITVVKSQFYRKLLNASKI